VTSVTVCLDCGGVLRAGLVYGPGAELTPCEICWRCGWQTNPVYERTRAERNCKVYTASAPCLGCGALLVAKQPRLLRAYCDGCYAARRVDPTHWRASDGR
jgi:hypothetical protein